MLEHSNAIANLAVKSLDIAKPFYQDILGLTLLERMENEVLIFKSGDTLINVYRSDYAGTNKATAVTWKVKNVEDTVAALKVKGVTFEHYDMPGMKRSGDVHRAGEMKVAWFKDPDGNILNIVNA